MIAKTLSGAVKGIEATIVEVQCDVSPRLPTFKIVGLPEKEIRESRERIQSAITNSGYEFPTKRIVANLAPADLKKEGGGLDLPIACTILQATGQLTVNNLDGKLLLGELSLDGEIRSVEGVLPVILEAREEKGIEEILVPEDNAPEASLVDSIDAYPVNNLSETIKLLDGKISKKPHEGTNHWSSPGTNNYKLDFSEVQGQDQAKRALCIAAAGGHNVLMSGPPGAGKSMLVNRLPTILPPLSYEESLSVTKVYSVVGQLSSEFPFITKRPVRSPHHTISYAGMVGGGHGNPRPGEVSLAHNGVLFLDELPEFSRRVLETLRQPLESGEITISRASLSVTFPANFMLIAAMNPCPCGYLGDEINKCTCQPYQIKRYRNKISGPFLDRIDLLLHVQRVEKENILNPSSSKSSLALRRQVAKAKTMQSERYQEKGLTNAEMSLDKIEQYCKIDDDGKKIVGEAIDHFGLSARSYHTILKVARTIADLDQSLKISSEHLSEAIQYRSTREKLLNS